MAIQLDLFETPKTEMNALWEGIAALKLSQGKVRKRTFAEIDDLKEHIVQLQAEIDRLQAALKEHIGEPESRPRLYEAKVKCC